MPQLRMKETRGLRTKRGVWGSTEVATFLDRLRPLWSLLTEAVPQVVLDASCTAHLQPIHLLHRRVIEISDALLILAPYRDAQAVADTLAQSGRSGWCADRTRAVVDAVEVMTALQSYPKGPTCTESMLDHSRPATPLPSTLGGEIRRFSLLTDELCRHGLLTRVA